MKSSASIASLAAALVKASGEMKAIVKDSTNPAFKSSYASLEATVDATRPVLTKHGLAVMQGAANPETDEGILKGFNVETVVIHSSGEWLSNMVYVPVEKATAQGAVSALSYGRRAGLRAVFTLADTDDDGETAQNHAPRPASANRAPSPVARPTAQPSGASAPLAGVPNCPKCGGGMYDNRAENAERVAGGLKARPAFACKDKTGCKHVVWKESELVAAMAAALVPEDVQYPDAEDRDDLPF